MVVHEVPAMWFRWSRRWWLTILVAAWYAAPGMLWAQQPIKDKGNGDMLPAPRVVGSAASTGLLETATTPVDLPSALRLAGVQNPEILLALQRVEEAVAARQLAAAQLLPSANAGTSVNIHDGPLQASTGQIIEVNRGSMYLGLGAFAVGAGTVNIPGLVWTGNVSDVIYANLVSRERIRQQQFASQAVRNDVLVRVADAYLELARAEGRLAIAVKNEGEAAEVARVTAEFASKKGGLAKQSDADRAATELNQKRTDLLEAEGMVQTASARLAQVLSVDPSSRLQTADVFTVPRTLVPDPIPLPELLAMALAQRPELQERQAAIRAAWLELDGAKCLPFSPNLILGYSAGSFGGGSNLVAEGLKQADGSLFQQNRFGSFAGRQDVDAVVYWSLRNLGIGNIALIRLARTNVRSEELRQIEVLDRIRAEVAVAQARSRARFAQIATSEQAVKSSESGFKADVERTRFGVGLPIEVIDSMRLLARSRYAYLDAIVDYNRAQFELYGALGQPPADYLARPIAPPKGP
jgi:outer membrane protein TolC